jgi:hypothetical protein
MMPDERVIKSYVWHEGKCFFVSTINRDSSAMTGGRYAETIVWNFDWGKNERGSIVGQRESYTDSIFRHIKICQMLHDKGIIEEEE